MIIGRCNSKVKQKRAANGAAAPPKAAQDQKLYIVFCGRAVKEIKANLGQAEFDNLLLKFASSGE